MGRERHGINVTVRGEVVRVNSLLHCTGSDGEIQITNLCRQLLYLWAVLLGLGSGVPMGTLDHRILCLLAQKPTNQQTQTQEWLSYIKLPQNSSRVPSEAALHSNSDNTNECWQMDPDVNSRDSLGQESSPETAWFELLSKGRFLWSKADIPHRIFSLGIPIMQMR